MPVSNSTAISTLFNLAPYQLLLRAIVITLGLTILITGIFGNILNIIIFTCLGYYKHNACSLYIIARSTFDLCILIFGLGSRVLSQGFALDFTLSNSIWCRLRVPLIYVNTLSSYTVLCLQSIDAFLVTSPSASLRRMSNAHVAFYLILGSVFFWILEEIPYLFFQELMNSSAEGTAICVTVNSIYANYRTYFIYLWLTTVVPLIVIILFDWLTYRHLQLHARRRRTGLLSILTRQMTRMTLFHVIVVLLFQAPFAISRCYFLTGGISGDPVQKAQQDIAQQFFNIFGYGIYAVRRCTMKRNSETEDFVFQTSFYCYFMSSKRFRGQISHLVPFLQCRGNRVQP